MLKSRFAKGRGLPPLSEPTRAFPNTSNFNGDPNQHHIHLHRGHTRLGLLRLVARSRPTSIRRPYSSSYIEYYTKNGQAQAPSATAQNPKQRRTTTRSSQTLSPTSRRRLSRQYIDPTRCGSTAQIGAAAQLLYRDFIQEIQPESTGSPAAEIAQVLGIEVMDNLTNRSNRKNPRERSFRRLHLSFGERLCYPDVAQVST